MISNIVYSAAIFSIGVAVGIGSVPTPEIPAPVETVVYRTIYHCPPQPEPRCGDVPAPVVYGGSKPRTSPYADEFMARTSYEGKVVRERKGKSDHWLKPDKRRGRATHTSVGGVR